MEGIRQDGEMGQRQEYTTWEVWKERNGWSFLKKVCCEHTCTPSLQYLTTSSSTDTDDLASDDSTSVLAYEASKQKRGEQIAQKRAHRCRTCVNLWGANEGENGDLVTSSGDDGMNAGAVGTSNQGMVVDVAATALASFRAAAMILTPLRTSCISLWSSSEESSLS